MSRKVSEIVSSRIGNAITNVNVWGGVIYNVKSYGAKGDGVTDDTAAIQATHAAIVATGKRGTMVLPLGVYKINSLLTINVSYVSVVSYGAKIDASSITSGEAIKITGSVNPPYTQGTVVLEGFELLGNSRTGTVIGFKFDTPVSSGEGSSHITVRNVNIHAFGKGVYNGDRAYVINFENSDIYDCTDCIYTPVSVTDGGERMSYRGCTFFNAVSILNAGGAGDYYFSQCSFDYAQTYITTAGAFVLCESCHFEGIDTVQTQSMFFVTLGDYGGIIFDQSTFNFVATGGLTFPIFSSAANSRIGIQVDKSIMIITLGAFSAGYATTNKHRYLGVSNGGRLRFTNCESNKSGTEFYLWSEYQNVLSNPNFLLAIGTDWTAIAGTVAIDVTDGPFAGEQCVTLTNTGASMETPLIPITDDSNIKVAAWSKLVSQAGGSCVVTANYYSRNQVSLGTQDYVLNQSGAYDTIGTWTYKSMYPIADTGHTKVGKAFVKLTIANFGTLVNKIGRIYFSIE